MDSATASQDRAIAPAYARFMPRLRALYIDAIIMMVVAFGVLFVAVTLRSDNVARVLGFTIVVSWLLYEPLLVSFAGGTIDIAAQICASWMTIRRAMSVF